MHLSISDQGKAGHTIEVCYDRESKEIRVMRMCCPDHLYQVEQVLKALGAPHLLVPTTHGSQEKARMEALGYRSLPSTVIMIKEL